MKLKIILCLGFLAFVLNQNSYALTNTWTGVSNTDWNNPCNWSLYIIPQCGHDVVIPGGTVREPTLGSGQTGYCNTVSVVSTNGAVLTIQSSLGAVLNIGCTPCTACSYTVDVCPSDDSWTEYWFANTNRNSANLLRTQIYTNSNKHIWMKFPLGGIPTTATITLATLNIYNWQTSLASSINVDVGRCTNDTWDETTITWNNAPVGTCAAAFGSFSCNQTYGWKTVTATAAVQADFVAADYVTTLRLLIASFSTNTVDFRPKDYSSNRPYLQVVYSVP